MIVYLDHLIDRDGIIRKESWDRQLGADEQAALQRLIDVVEL